MPQPVSLTPVQTSSPVPAEAVNRQTAGPGQFRDALLQLLFGAEGPSGPFPPGAANAAAAPAAGDGPQTPAPGLPAHLLRWAQEGKQLPHAASAVAEALHQLPADGVDGAAAEELNAGQRRALEQLAQRWTEHEAPSDDAVTADPAQTLHVDIPEAEDMAADVAAAGQAAAPPEPAADDPMDGMAAQAAAAAPQATEEPAAEDDGDHGPPLPRGRDAPLVTGQPAEPRPVSQAAAVAEGDQGQQGDKAARAVAHGRAVADLAHERHPAAPPGHSRGAQGPAFTDVSQPVTEEGAVDEETLELMASKQDPAAAAKKGEGVNAQTIHRGQQISALASQLNQAQSPLTQGESPDLMPPGLSEVGRMPPSPTLSQGPGGAPSPHQMLMLNLPVKDQRWGEAFNTRINWMAQRDIPSAEIRLNPPHLGRILVKIEINEDQANVTLNTQHASVRDAVEAALPRLREMLAESGLQLGDAHVGTEEGSQQFAGGDGEGHERAMGESAAADGLALGEQEADEQTGVRVSNGLVDTFA